MEMKVVTKDNRAKIDLIFSNFDNGNIDDYIGIIGELTPNVVDRAVYNEYGTANAPSRPFLEPTVLKNKNYITQQVKKHLRKLENPNDFMNIISQSMVDKIKHKIDTMKYPRLAESTIKRKGRNDLLKDTEEMYRSITYKRVYRGK